MNKTTVLYHIASAIITLLLIPCLSNGEEETVDIIESCIHGSNIYYPYDQKSYTVKWNGEYPGLSGCKVSFQGLGTEGSTYKVCIKVDSFYLQGPGIYLNIDAGSPPNKTEESYSQYDDPEEFCGGQDQVVNVEVEADRIAGHIYDTSRSYFRLTVTAFITNETYTIDYPWQLILVFVCFIILCPFGIIARCIRRRKAQTQANTNVLLTRRGSQDDVYSAVSTSAVQVQDTDTASGYQPLSGATNVHNGTAEISLEHPTKDPSQFSFPITVRGKSEEHLHGQAHPEHGGYPYTADTTPTAPPFQPSAPPFQPSAPHDFIQDMPPPSYSDVMNNK